MPTTSYYRLEHRTTYTYETTVTSSYGRALILPRQVGGQHVHATSLTVTPEPGEIAEHLDVHGNRVTYFHVTSDHTELEVVARSLLTIDRRSDPARLPHVAWEESAAQVAVMRATGQAEHGEGASSVMSIVDHSLPSEHASPGESVLAYAAESFAPDRPLVAAAWDLCHRIFTDLEYAPGTTTVRTTLEEILERRRGVCQDYAHLMVAALRAVGQSARYVSGYIETRPPPGREKLRGVDATHAWVAVWVPGGGWVHLDPTNDQFVDSRYVVLGWGRDFRDVSPLSGIVYRDEGSSTLDVGVDLWPVDQAELTDLVARAERGEQW
ncbi:transglutaminase family protein [Georgenia sp. Z1491]|uniref:transglutaminase family protein n=1 Tax=Georgenia sp. Z1491 TaxID=3416707 RepID=UPI003CEBD92F